MHTYIHTYIHMHVQYYLMHICSLICSLFIYNLIPYPIQHCFTISWMSSTFNSLHLHCCSVFIVHFPHIHIILIYSFYSQVAKLASFNFRCVLSSLHHSCFFKVNPHAFSALALLVGRQWWGEWWGAGMVIWLGRGANLHMTHLIPLLLTVCCCRKSRLVLVLPFWYQLNQDKIQRAVKRWGSSSCRRRCSQS